MDQTVSRRFEPSSRTTLMGEQPNPSDLLQTEDVMSRHRGAKPSRRCELLGKISLFSMLSRLYLRVFSLTFSLKPRLCHKLNIMLSSFKSTVWFTQRR